MLMRPLNPRLSLSTQYSALSILVTDSFPFAVCT